MSKKVVCDICGKEFGAEFCRPQTIKVKWVDNDTGEKQRRKYEVHERCLEMLIRFMPKERKEEPGICWMI